MSLQASKDLLVCIACGTQYNVPLGLTPTHEEESTFIPASDSTCPLKACRMCDDPRQFVPPSGHQFTTLERLWESGKYKNVFERTEEDANVVEIWTEPKFGIGQRACLIQTPHGNVLWDLVAYIDSDTVDKINQLGGISFIVISHPHFYTTWTEWSTTFNCPIYTSAVDANEWLNRPKTSNLKLIDKTHTLLLPGLTAIQAGGHFPGSMMLHSSPPNTRIPTLFVADTIMSVPSAFNPQPKQDASSTGTLQPKYFVPNSRTLSYTFMYSIPNMTPLDPDTILQIWRSMKGFDFRATYGVFAKSSVVREAENDRQRGLMGLNERVLESMKIFCRSMGYGEHEIMTETVG